MQNKVSNVLNCPIDYLLNDKRVGFISQHEPVRGHMQREGEDKKTNRKSYHAADHDDSE